MCVGVAATAHIVLWWTKACRQSSAGAVAQVGAIRGCPISWWHKRGQHCGLAGGGALQDTRMSPGGRLQPGCEATAGLACVCPDRRAPARPLMGKACGQTSGSGTGNTQSIIGASWIPALPHAGQPECRCPPCRPPATARSGKGRRSNVGRAAGRAGAQLGTTARADSVGGHTDSMGAAAPGQGLSSVSRRCWHSPGITCLREAGGGQGGYSTGAV